MTLRIAYIVLVLSFRVNPGIAQQLSFSIDSVKIYHLPLSMQTPSSLSDNDVGNWSVSASNIDILKINLVNDSADLKALENTNLFGESYLTDKRYQIDTRIVIDVFLESRMVLTIAMNKIGYYILNDEKRQRSRNKELIDWLKKYIEELK